MDRQGNVAVRIGPAADHETGAPAPGPADSCSTPTAAAPRFELGWALRYASANLGGSQVQTVGQAVVILVVTGAANALCTVLLFPMLTDLLPQDRAGEFTGLGAGVWELAQPLGAVIGGLAADATGTLSTTLLVAALLTLVAAALLIPVRTPARRIALANPQVASADS